MKKSNCLKPLLYLACLACYTFSCTKENEPEIIGVANELTEYEKYAEYTNLGTHFGNPNIHLLTKDEGSISYTHYGNAFIHEGKQTILPKNSIFKLDHHFNWFGYMFLERPGYLSYLFNLIQLEDGSLLFMLDQYDSYKYIGPSIVKLSKDGEFLWEKELRELKTAHCISLHQISDDGFAILYSDSSDSSFYSEILRAEISYRDWSVIKADKDGNNEWSKTSGEPVYDYDSQCIIQTADKGYLVEVASFYTVLGNDTKSHIVKLDQFGNMIKNTELLSLYLENTEIIESNDGGYILAALHYPPNSNDPILYLFNINNAGDIVWSKEHVITAEEGFSDLHMAKLLNTGYFVVLGGNGRYSIFKFNNSGDLIE